MTSTYLSNPKLKFYSFVVETFFCIKQYNKYWNNDMNCKKYEVLVTKDQFDMPPFLDLHWCMQ